MGRTWPAWSAGTLRPEPTWTDVRRDGPLLAYSVLTDLAILLGELILRCRPGACWSVDLDAEDLDDEMTFSRRVVVRLPTLPRMPCPTWLDVEDVVVHRFERAVDPITLLLDDWTQLVMDATSGGYEAAWLPDPAEPWTDVPVHPDDPPPRPEPARALLRELPDHRATLLLRFDLARAHGHAGDPHAAVAALTGVLAGQLRVLGPEHPDTLITGYDLAYWRARAGDPAGAASALGAVLPELERVLGAGCPSARAARADLGRWAKRGSRP